MEKSISVNPYIATPRECINTMATTAIAMKMVKKPKETEAIGQRN